MLGTPVAGPEGFTGPGPGSSDCLFLDRRDYAMDCSREPSNLGKFTDELVRAYREYLGVPSLIIVGFIALALGMAALEQGKIPEIDALRHSLSASVFGDVEYTREILISSAATLITITSITFTVLLLAVQQAASAMSTQIIDQFLRRPVNQFLFGYFVGMSIYTLIILAVVREDFSPVLSTTLAFFFAGIALYFLAALVYITLTQMRSTIVIHAIHDVTLQARRRQLPLLRRTRRAPQLAGAKGTAVRSRGDGYVSDIRLTLIEKALPADDDVEIVLKVRIGSYVAHRDEVAEIRSRVPRDTHALQEAVLKAVRLSRARDLQRDAGNGVEQILNIGWVSVSSGQHSPSAGAEAIHALQDLLSEWSIEPAEEDTDALPVVYRDRIAILPLRGIESLAVASIESRQHQSFGHVLQALAAMFDRLPENLREEAEAMVLRMLTWLGNQVLTVELQEALERVADIFDAAGRQHVALAVRKALVREEAAQTR